VVRVSIFLIAVTLIAGVVVYDSDYGSRESYTLTIASTTGGSVITPGEGTFTYYEGAVVDLVAGIELGHRCVNWTGDVGTVANVNDATTTIAIIDHCSITANFEEVNIVIAAGDFYTMGLRLDSTVVVAGYSRQNYYGERNVSNWTDITKVTLGYTHMVGLKSDGTVIAVGGGSHGQCNVSDWTDISGVAAGSRHTVGLKNNGTVVAVGRNYEGQCDVDDWTTITQIASGYYHTVGPVSYTHLTLPTICSV